MTNKDGISVEGEQLYSHEFVLGQAQLINKLSNLLTDAKSELVAQGRAYLALSERKDAEIEALRTALKMAEDRVCKCPPPLPRGSYGAALSHKGMDHG